jgi:hypothetical protein
VVSIETLVHGGLIPSRITDTPLDACLKRLDVLRRIRARHEDLTIYAFNIITRISNSNHNEEEPRYWDQYGKLLWTYSRLWYRVTQLGMSEEEAALAEVEKAIPPEIIDDYTKRRQRNHQINQDCVELVAEGAVDFLLFTQDDTSEFGFPNHEQRLLRERISELGIEDRAVVYPGADEVGMVLVARHLNRIHQVTPRFFTRYSSVRGPLIVASYEDRPIAESVKGQIYGVGGLLVDSPHDADIILFLNTPGEKQGEAPLQSMERTVDTSARNILEFVQAIRMYGEGGHVIAVADLAYCNGGDLKLVSLMEKQLDLTKLDAYGGWNTAGNTLGTVVSQAALRLLAKKQGDRPERYRAHLEFLLLRFADDWAYQAIVRTEIGQRLVAEGIDIYRLGDQWSSVQATVQQRLPDVVGAFFERNFQGKELPGGGILSAIRLENTHLPWERLFEVGCEVILEVSEA